MAHRHALHIQYAEASKITAVHIHIMSQETANVHTEIHCFNILFVIPAPMTSSILTVETSISLANSRTASLGSS